MKKPKKAEQSPQYSVSLVEADTVIVGGGVSGLYCAWRLLKENSKKKVVVLEKTGRIGGRLDTDHVYILDNEDRPVEVKDEQGGMRFNLQMPELLNLAAELGLCDQIIPFGMGNRHNRYTLRGRSFTRAEAADNTIWSTIYRLSEREQGKSPAQLMDEVYHAVLAENHCTAPTNPTPKYWQDFRLKCTYKGIPLNQWGLWSLLRAFGYTQECIEMLTDTLGFTAPFEGESNAGTAFQLLEDFPSDPQFYAFSNGFSTLTDTLEQQVLAMGGIISVNSTVTSLQREDEKLTVRWSRPRTPESTIYEHNFTFSGNVILALPTEALGPLAQNSPLFKEYPEQAQRLQDSVAGVAGIVLTKINLYYPEAWWRNGTTSRPPVQNGPSFTDLPTDSVYVFDPLVGESGTGPAALTIYCDFDNASFWQELQEIGPLFNSTLQEEHNKQVPQLMFAASQAVVAEATRQLKDVFSTNAVPQPVLTSYRRWDDSALFGFAYHQWARGADDSQIIPFLVQPLEGVPVYTCNEAASDQQGWVNGSLRSCELVLTNHFGLSPLVPNAVNWKLPCELTPVKEGQQRITSDLRGPLGA